MVFLLCPEPGVSWGCLVFTHLSSHAGAELVPAQEVMGKLREVLPGHPQPAVPLLRRAAGALLARGLGQEDVLMRAFAGCWDPAPRGQREQPSSGPGGHRLNHRLHGPSASACLSFLSWSQGRVKENRKLVIRVTQC